MALLLKTDTLPLDPSHGRSLPAGRALFPILRSFFRRQGDDVRRQIKHGTDHVNLDRWTQPMAEASEEAVLRYYERGAREILARLRRNPEVVARRALGRVRAGYDVFNEQVAVAARSAALTFCQATNATATRELNEALSALREGLAVGLETGEAQRDLTARVQELFADPLRAHRIATTEASRASHSGQLMLAQGTDGLIRASRWLASSDACGRCLALNGREVELGQSFATEAGGGPYAVIYHPPRHPFLYVKYD